MNFRELRLIPEWQTDNSVNQESLVATGLEKNRNSEMLG